MPIIGILLNGVDFKTLAYRFTNPITSKSVDITYGNFIQSVFDFTIVAFALFLFVTMLNKAMSKVKKKQEKEESHPPMKPDDVKLLEEIRDILKSKKDMA